MKLSDFVLRLRALLQRHRVEQELDEELRFHLEMETKKYVEAGMTPDHARVKALRGFGGVSRTAEECRDARGISLFDTLAQDVRYAIRVLGRSPYFSLTAIVTLGIGIGANTAIFTAVNSTLVRSLPYRDPDELVQVFENRLNKADSTGFVKPADFLDFRKRSRTIEGFATYDSGLVSWTGQGEPERLRQGMVSANFFRLLRAEPLIGRNLDDSEEEVGKHRVVLLSHGLWKQRLGGDMGIAGRSLTLDGNKYTIIGVLPESFQFADVGSPDVWVPFSLPPGIRQDRYGNWMQVIARMRSGVTMGQAQGEMDAIAAQLRTEYPSNNSDVGVHLAPLHQQLVSLVRPGLLALMFAVGLVLLIACANVANLLLARAVPRQREMAIRTALGAGRGRLVRQVLVETLLLSLGGSLLGLLLGSFGLKLVLATIPAGTLAYFPYLRDASLDGTVLGFTFALSVFTAVLCGLLPALISSRQYPQDTLKGGGFQSTSSGGRQMFRSVLVIAEIALAAMLLITSGLTVRSLLNVLSVEPGFRRSGLLTARASLPGNKYRDAAKVIQSERDVLSRLEQLPGVRSAAVLSCLPMSGADFTAFGVENRNDTSWGRPALHYTVISPGALQTMAIPLRQGREFTEFDTEGSTKVVIVNETLARRFFADETPIGKRIVLWRINRELREIVGITRDIKDLRLDRPTEPAAYLPFRQAATAGSGAAGSLDLRLVVLSDKPVSQAQGMRAAMGAVERDAPISDIKTMDELVSESPLLVRRRVPSLLVGALALTALLLAALGISGVLGSAVNQRVQEIGIRIALGAKPADVQKMIFGQSLRLIGIGLVLGAAGALGAARLIASWMFGITPTDPVTYGSVVLTLTIVGLVSCYFPARRATRIDPTLALRCE